MYHQANERVFAVDLVPAPRQMGEGSSPEIGQEGGGPGGEHAGMPGEVSGGTVSLARR